MLIFKTRHGLDKFITKEKQSGRSIGFVPTMGALHKGHQELVKTSIKQNDITVTSIFVNPTQFNNQDDFNKYPKTVSNDIKKLEEVYCDVLFLPELKEIYPKGQSQTTINPGIIASVLEGKKRPGHFDGVALVVAKLFNIVNPDTAYFGQKDFQQCAVIKQIVKDLDFKIKLKFVPTVREKNGLAMSSRNIRLSEKARYKASLIYKALSNCKSELMAKQTPKRAIQASLKILDTKDFKIDYFEIVESESLSKVDKIAKGVKYTICTAVFLEDVRLIDNVVFRV